MTDATMSAENSQAAASEFDRSPVTPDRLLSARHFAASYAGEHVAGTEFVIGAMFVAWGVSTGAVIGSLILVFTWLPLPTPRGRGNLSLALLGFYQTGLGMLAGATGPLGAALLLQRNRERDWLVVNTAVYMTLNHALRLAAFAALGFSFAPWWPLLAGMVGAGIAGSWVGTRLRHRVPQRDFHRTFRVVVTLLALRMIAHPFLDTP